MTLIIPKKVFIYGTSCCSPEIEKIFNSIYNLERLGFYRINKLKDADIIIVSGEITENEEIEITKITNRILTFGNCSIQNTKNDKLCLGCPPRIESLIDGLIEASK